MRKRGSGLVLLGLLVGAAAAAAAPAADTSDHLPSTQSITYAYPTHEVRPAYPAWAEEHRAQGCVRLSFTIGTDGRPSKISVWSRYPSRARMYDQPSIKALRQWRFQPQVEHGVPVVSQADVEFKYSFDLHGNKRVTSSHPDSNIDKLQVVMDDTLSWICRQPAEHGIRIFTPNSRPPADVHEGFSGEAYTPLVLAPAPDLPKGRPGRVEIGFCVDPEGRVSDTTYKNPSLGDIARQALEQVKFPARQVGGKPVWTCGLVVTVSYLGRRHSSDGRIGEISDLTFQTLTGHVHQPKLMEEKPVSLSLRIPPGTKLPAVAKVELRFCIEKNGSVSEPKVIQADPPKLFDEAAIKTVESWHYAAISRRMCDVYNWVRFPLSE